MLWIYTSIIHTKTRCVSHFYQKYNILKKYDWKFPIIHIYISLINIIIVKSSYVRYTKHMHMFYDIWISIWYKFCLYCMSFHICYTHSRSILYCRNTPIFQTLFLSREKALGFAINRKELNFSKLDFGLRKILLRSADKSSALTTVQRTRKDIISTPLLHIPL